MTTRTFADGDWHHAATFDGSYAIVDIDGEPLTAPEIAALAAL